jgi:hypothetical protein
MVLLDEMGTEVRYLSAKSLDLKSFSRRQADRVSSRRQALGPCVLLNTERNRRYEYGNPAIWSPIKKSWICWDLKV